MTTSLLKSPERITTQLSERFKAEIVSGQYPADRPMPSFSALAGRFGISKSTIHEAFKELAREGYLFIKQGKGDFLVKGLVDTSLYLKAILDKEARLVEPGSTLSHFVLFETSHYHKLFAVTDAAILISPDLEQKRKIIQNSVNIMRTLGVDKPNVSVVCPVEKVNPKIQSTVDAAELVKMSQDGRLQNCVVEGPYDIYITFSRKLADEKGLKVGVGFQRRLVDIIHIVINYASPGFWLLAALACGT